jgi:hypothetical protein
VNHWQERLQAAFPSNSVLFNGQADDFSFVVDSIDLIGGEFIPLQDAGVTAIVGAHDAGTSTVLRKAPSHRATPTKLSGGLQAK